MSPPEAGDDRSRQRRDKVTRFAIIGAGLSGLACAHELVNAGHHVTLFDKGRGPGGRMSTRRVATPAGEACFDHGAQFFTARDPRFQTLVAELMAKGAVALWDSTRVRRGKDGTTSPLFDEPIYVGTPGMNGLVRGLAEGLNVRWGQRVSAVGGQPGAWMLALDTGAAEGPFEAVICAIPAEQVDALLGTPAPAQAQAANKVRSVPCWAGLFAFDARLPLSWGLARFDDHPVIDVISATLDKPGRTGPAAYVVHARSDWSTRHLEDSADEVATHLLGVLAEVAGLPVEALPATLVRQAHRWRYSRVETGAGQDFIYDAGLRIGVCGDWLTAPRVESAWLSGHLLGAHLTA